MEIGLTQGGERVAEGRLNTLEGRDEASGISDLALLLAGDLVDSGNGSANNATSSVGHVLDNGLDTSGLDDLERSGNSAGGHKGDGEEADGLHVDG